MGSKDSAMEYLATLPTGFITDALSKMNLMYQSTMGIFPLRGFEDAHIGGPVATIKYAPLRPTGAKPKVSFFEALKSVKPGSVLCIEAAPHLTFSGDNQANMAKKAGVIGVVLDGGTRDISGLRQVGLPFWAQQPATRLMSSQWELAEYDVPINLGGVQVKPGDFIVADEDGTVVVPEEVIEQTAELAAEVVRIEDQLEKLINSGGSADEVAALYARKGVKVPIKR